MDRVQSPVAGRIPDAVRRLTAALERNPSLVITIGVAEHFCALDAHACGSLLAAFEQARRLVRRPDGAYVAARQVPRLALALRDGGHGFVEGFSGPPTGAAAANSR